MKYVLTCWSQATSAGRTYVSLRDSQHSWDAAGVMDNMNCGPPQIVTWGLIHHDKDMRHSAMTTNGTMLSYEWGFSVHTDDEEEGVEGWCWKLFYTPL